MIVPRQYQIDGIREITEALSRFDRVLYVLPTGGGKTVTFSLLARDLEFSRIMLMAHRIELIDQIGETLERVGADMGRIHLDTVQTIASRLKKIDRPGLIICDEAHHSVAGQYKKIFDHYGTKVLGVTATPCRMDGRGLCEQYQHMVKGPSMGDLIGMGSLVPSLIYSLPGVIFDGLKKRCGDFAKDELDERMQQVKDAVMGDAIEQYKKIANGKKAVVFTHSVAMAKDVCEEFRAAGYRFSPLDGGMSKTERKAVVDGIRNGELDGIASCEIVSEGFDCPGLEAAILLRPTSSLSLYMQQVGRVLRPARGKSHGIIVDHVGNAHRFGPPEIDRVWTLEGKDQGQAKSKNDVLIRTCSECFAVIPQRSPNCPICGAERYKKEREVLQIDGELVVFEYGEKTETLFSQSENAFLNMYNGFLKTHGLASANIETMMLYGVSRGNAFNMLKAAKKNREITNKEAPMADKIYCGSGKQGNYGIRLNICLDEIPEEHITTSQNGKQYVRMEVKTRREPDRYGNTHSVEVDTWKPTPRNEDF